MHKMIFAAAFVTVPAQAFAAENYNTFDAFAFAAIGYQDSGISGDSIDGNASDDVSLALRGSIAAPLSKSIGIQADVTYSRDPLNHPFFTGLSVKSATTAAHLFYRGSDRFLVGAIGQVNFNEIGLSVIKVDAKQYFIGGEAQLYANKFTLTGQLAYRKDNAGELFSNISFDGVAATAEVKYFLNKNWSLGLKGEYSDLSSKLGTGNPNIATQSVDQWRIGLATERRLSSMPISFFANINYGENIFDGANIVAHVKPQDVRGLVGLKINFGAQSLEERNSSGASLDPFKADQQIPMPTFGYD